MKFKLIHEWRIACSSRAPVQLVISHVSGKLSVTQQMDVKLSSSSARIEIDALISPIKLELVRHAIELSVIVSLARASECNNDNTIFPIGIICSHRHESRREYLLWLMMTMITPSGLTSTSLSTAVFKCGIMRCDSVEFPRFEKCAQRNSTTQLYARSLGWNMKNHLDIFISTLYVHRRRFQFKTESSMMIQVLQQCTEDHFILP